MDINSFKKALEKARGNNLVVFLFFLLVSCSLWLSLTLNRIYETDIYVSVSVGNIPAGVALEDEEAVSARAVVRGEGTDLFGYHFNDGISVSVDYSEFTRKGGRLTMPVSSIRSKVVEQLDPSLSLKGFLSDSLVAAVQRRTAMVPVMKNRLDLNAAEGCELLSVEYEPDEVCITALVDELPSIKEVWTSALVCDSLERDTVFDVTFLPGKYIDVTPSKVRVSVAISRYVDKQILVPVEYVKFPSDIDLGFMPQDVNVAYEVLEADTGKVRPSDFSVQLLFDDYASSVMTGKPGDLEKNFIISSVSPYVRNASVVDVEVVDASSGSNPVKI